MLDARREGDGGGGRGRDVRVDELEDSAGASRFHPRSALFIAFGNAETPATSRACTTRLKYLSAMPVIALSAAKYHVDHTLWLNVLRPAWITCAVVNTAYSYYWDVRHDWDLNVFGRGRRSPPGVAAAGGRRGDARWGDETVRSWWTDPSCTATRAGWSGRWVGGSARYSPTFYRAAVNTTW